MKKFALSCIAICLLLTGCKYDEGPFISLREAETRLVGVWELINVYKNGEIPETVPYAAYKPGTYYTFYFDYLMSVTAIVNNNVRESTQGFWRFLDNEKNLEVQFQLPGESYFYEAQIKRLTMSELRYEFTDDEGNVWRFEMFSRSHY
ncbi:MAG: hypothetical protein H6Q25_391 [Bacteroidetes bacterium]|nr:hypothetical protein [Bacteroidota bacterium]